MAIETDDSRLGRLEGRAEEMSKAIQDLRAGQRQILLALYGYWGGSNRAADYLGY